MLQILSRLKIDLGKIEPPTLVLLLLFYSGAWYQHIHLVSYESEFFLPPDDPVKKLVTIATYGIIAFMVVNKWKQLATVLTKDFLFTLFIGLSIASIFWSASPEVTADNAKALIRSTVLGAYIAMRYEVKDILCLVRRVTMIAVGLSTILFIINPTAAMELGLLDIPSGFRGVFLHKNDLGEVMTLGAFAFLIPALNSRKFSYRFLLGLLLSVIFLVFADAKTPLIAFCGVISSLIGMKFLFKKPYKLQVILGVIFLLVTVFLSIFFYVFLGDFLIAIGRDPTFNGRTDVWSIVLEKVAHNPLLGYGYRGYWGAFIDDFKADFHLRNPMAAWTPGHAHSGFLELLLSLGVIGFLIFMISFVKALFRAINKFRTDTKPESVWYVQIFLFTIIINVTGGLIPSAAGLSWILYVVALYSIALDCRKIHPRPFSQPVQTSMIQH